jgi:hypothetical protein
MMSDPEKERRAEKAAENFLRRHLINARSETLHTLQQACAQLIRVRARLNEKTAAAVRITSRQPKTGTVEPARIETPKRRLKV